LHGLIDQLSLGIAKIALRKQRDSMAREYVSIASTKLIRNSTLNPSEV
jgi:hypothetical protein